MSGSQRRNYFIDKSFQTKFILRFCLLNIVASLVTAVLIYLFNQQTKTVVFEGLELVVKSTSDFILPMLLQILAAVFILVSLATIVVILFASHKIAGPLYRLTLELEKIKKGDLTGPIHIRAKDQLQKVAVEFEGMREGYRDSFSALKTSWADLRAELNILKSTLRDEERKKMIQKQIDKIDSELGHYTTE